MVYSDSCDIEAKLGLAFLNHTLASGDDPKCLEKAEELMLRHVARGLAIKSHHHRNLGIVYNRLMLRPEHNTADTVAKMRGAFRTYLSMADAAGEAVKEREAIEHLVNGAGGEDETSS